MFDVSLTQKILFEGHTFYLKRDDLLSSSFSGNKARKFYYFLTHDFKDIDTLISYGSIQSNSMYSLGILCQQKGWKFEYYIDHLPSYLKEHPHGNYLGALKSGMRVKKMPLPVAFNKNILLIEEGGREKEAEYGIKILAQEIEDWRRQNSIKQLDIFLPSGTGTTALFLQKHLKNLRVFTTPCVGDSDYLTQQFSLLEKNRRYHPTILTLEKKHHFGKLYRENYEIWLKLQQQTTIEFDLLYDPLGWRTLLAHIKVFKNPILYIHQGGILGNESMLPRYERKYKDMM